MELLGPQLHYLGEKIRGLPHAIRESWPLNRVPRSRDWELLIIAYLVAMAIALIIFFIFTQKSYGP
jgi:hypothetical protein